jgi:hypothetical protein
MGFYLRKSVNVGPFRFNLSKSGVGVSTGFKGFRVGTGPRGNYISVGHGGLHYRATIPSAHPSVPPTAPATPTSIPNSVPQLGLGPMVPIESAPVSAMQDTSSAELLSELNSKASRPNYWVWTAAGSMPALWYVHSTAPGWITAVSAAAVVALTAYLAVRDTVAKTAVLFYELEAANETAFEALHEAFRTLAGCRRAWRIDAQAAVHNAKYHAGVGSVVRRKDAQFGTGLPPMVKSNLEVPYVKSGSTALYYMPDRVLVYSAAGVGAVSYKDLEVSGHSRQFVEDGAVPGDAEVVGYTWQFVNKSGEPDRRFKNNRQLSIALYEELSFRSASGLNELYQLSKHSLSAQVRTEVQGMSLLLPAYR